MWWKTKCAKQFFFISYLCCISIREQHPECIKNTFLSPATLPTPLLRISGQGGIAQAWQWSRGQFCCLGSAFQPHFWPSQETQSPWWSLENRSSLLRTPIWTWKVLASQYVCQVDLSVSPDLIVGFRREEGSWVQVPVQVKSSIFTFGLFTSYQTQSFLR